MRGLAPEAPECPLLENAKELRLRRRRERRGVVEVRRAVAGRFQEPAPRGDRARERAPLVPEHLALEELIGQVCRVDPHEGLLRARRPIMNRSRQVVLARPALPKDQYRARQLQRPLERRHLPRQRPVLSPQQERRRSLVHHGILPSGRLLSLGRVERPLRKKTGSFRSRRRPRGARAHRTCAPPAERRGRRRRRSP